MKFRFSIFVFAAVFAAALSWTVPAHATLDIAKAYKSAFGTEKPKCTTCHVDKVPKKEDGKHDLNDYGKKIVAANPKPDEETLKQVGQNPAAEF